MDISTSARPVSPPPAGTLRLIYEDGHVRAVDSNGRKLRISTEYGTPDNAEKATGSIEVVAIAADDTVTIFPNEYTFVSELTTPAVPYEVKVGETDSDSIDNLIAAINGASGAGTTYGTGTVAHPDVVASAGTGDTMDVTARFAGPSGNIAVSCSLTDGSWSGDTLTGGQFATLGSQGDQMFYSNGTVLFRYFAVKDVALTTEDGWVVIQTNL